MNGDLPLDSRLRARPLQKRESGPTPATLARETDGYSAYQDAADAEMVNPLAEAVLAEVASGSLAAYAVPGADGTELLLQDEQGDWFVVDAVEVAGESGILGLRALPPSVAPAPDERVVQLDVSGCRRALYAYVRSVGAELVPPAELPVLEPARDDDELRAEVAEQFDAVLAPQLAPAWSEQVGSPPRPAARDAYGAARVSDFAVLTRSQYDELRSVAAGAAALTASASAQQAGELVGRVSRATASLPAGARALLREAGAQAGDDAAGSVALRTAAGAAAQARLALALNGACLAVLKESGTMFLAGASS